MQKAKEEKYNFHAHTYRCRHATQESETDYLDRALLNNFKKYGFSDHVPVHPIFYWDDCVRMHSSEFSEYLNCIENLKEIYRGIIEVFSGFEAEYDEIIEQWLCFLRDKCDYMILGQHYVLNRDIRNTSIYPIKYAKKVCKAIESGIFDIVAHPDIFMQNRFFLESDIDRDEFLKNARIAAIMICLKAKEYDIPLELNLGGTKLYKLNLDSKSLEEGARYPTKLFWDIVSEFGNDVVVGVDSHSVNDIPMRDDKLRQIGKYIDLSKLKFLPTSYDPVSARRKNLKLQEAYDETKSNLTSVEGRLIDSFISDFVKDIDFDKNTIKNIVKEKIKESCFRSYSTALDYITEERRKELLKVVNESIDRVQEDFGIDKDNFRKILKNDIDNYYSFRPLSKIKVIVDSKKS